MQFEEFLLNELDFYLGKKKKRGNFEITPFLLKTDSTGVPQWIIHLLKVSLSLVAIWGNFIKWAGLLLSKKKKKKWGNSETTPFSLKTYSTGVAQSIEHLLKFSLSLVAIWEHFIKWAGLLLSEKKKKKQKFRINSVCLENLLNKSPTVYKTPAESFIEFGCNLKNFY